MIRLLTLVVCGTVAGSSYAAPRSEHFCSFAPSQSKVMAGVSGAVGGAAIAAKAVAAAAGLTVVTHSSGALILTGSGYIAGTIGGAAAAPVIVGVALLVGGTAVTVELVCVAKNHPAMVA